jgi:hypothetical protein
LFANGESKAALAALRTAGQLWPTHSLLPFGATLLHGVLPHFRGRLSQGREGLIPDFDSALHPGIVEAFDIVKKDVGPCFDQGQVAATADAFAFDHAEETLPRVAAAAVTFGRSFVTR